MKPANDPSDSDLAEFAERVERGLTHMYHGETVDRRVRYRVVEGAWPEGLSGRVFSTVFPYEAVMSGREMAAAPNMLAAPGRVLITDLAPEGDPAAPSFSLRLTAVRNESWHLRQLAPEAFVRTDFAEFSWFGLSNLSNTTPVPTFPGPEGGARLVMTYDAGRPIEVSPEDLSLVTLIGRVGDYHAAARGVFTPMIMTTGHPVYDPSFEPDAPRLIYTNLVPRIDTFLRPDAPVRADLYLTTWDGEAPGPTRPMRVWAEGRPVTLDHASAHQLCLTRDHVVILGSTLVLGVASLVNPLRPLLRDALRDGARDLFGDVGVALFDRANARVPGRHAASVPPSLAVVYVIHKRDLRRALLTRADRVEAKEFTLDWEATHAVTDYDCDGDRITLYAQHNVGADPADQLEPGDRLMQGGFVRTELEGILSSSTDLNQVRRHVIDLRCGKVTTTAFPEPDGEDFAYGLNLLPPVDPMPYRAEGDPAGHDLLRCRSRVGDTVWVAGGYIPCTMDQRVFQIFHNARVSGRQQPRRLVPLEEFLGRIERASHTGRVFRLDEDLRIESAYALAPGWFIATPTFVPRRDAASLRDGWLVTHAWGPDHPHTEVWVWDAARPLSDGPCAKLGPDTAADALRPGFPLHSAWMHTDDVRAWKPPSYRVPTLEVPRSLKAVALTTLVGSAVVRWAQQRVRA